MNIDTNENIEEHQEVKKSIQKMKNEYRKI